MSLSYEAAARAVGNGRKPDVEAPAGYEYVDGNERNVVIPHGKNGVESEVYLVGLSRVRCVHSESGSRRETGDVFMFDRAFKRQRITGPSIHLGPIPYIMQCAEEAFEEITAWIENTERVLTARCIGWVDDSPDWLEIAISSEDKAKFEPLWAGRPN
ncbi:hypothetical protein APHAL10511_000666 [Amanita phalloides]|nr:hypothetical protein APHAL10511_000666 [Amanita phalloides]